MTSQRQGVLLRGALLLLVSSGVAGADPTPSPSSRWDYGSPRLETRQALPEKLAGAELLDVELRAMAVAPPEEKEVAYLRVTYRLADGGPAERTAGLILPPAFASTKDGHVIWTSPETGETRVLQVRVFDGFHPTLNPRFRRILTTGVEARLLHGGPDAPGAALSFEPGYLPPESFLREVNRRNRFRIEEGRTASSD